MATTGKKGKKQKGKTLGLSEFLAEDNGGLSGQAVVMAPSKSSWADEMAEEEQTYSKEKLILPTAPRAARGAHIDESKIPNTAPYTAYIANLPYDIEMEDVTKFFRGLRVRSVRLPRDGGEGGRLRGFGYAEFESRQELVDALSMNDLMIKNRKIRIDIASGTDGEEQGGGMGRGRGRPPRDESREDRTPSDWRSAPRDAPPPLREGFRDRGDREERTERYAAGFNPREAARGPPPSERSSFGQRRDGPPSYGRDRDGPPSYGRDRDGPYGRDRDGASFGRDRDGSSFGRDRDGPSYGRDRDGPSFGRRDGGDRYTDRAEPPKERPKLSLKPRSIPLEEVAPPAAVPAAAPVAAPADSESAPAAAAGGASIFGGAKPVDTAAREREIEERLKEKEREREREPPRGRESTRAESKEARDGSPASGSGRAPEPRGQPHEDEDRDYRPPHRDDRDYRPPRDQDRDYRPPRDQDRDYRPPRDHDRDYRPPRSSDRDYRPPRGDQDRDYWASRDADRDYRPPRDQDRDYRPPRDYDRDYRAPRDQDRDYRAPRGNDRDDHRENGHYRAGAGSNRSAGGNSRPPPRGGNERNRDGGERPRSRDGGSHSPSDGSRIRKLEEPKAPVFENRNKFSFLEDENENESDSRDD